MKLPNFILDASMNALRTQMGAELGAFVPARSRNLLTMEELANLSKRGLDISIDEVKVLPDGTLAFKDRRVLLYIRDVSEYAGKDHYSLPRFHVADCRTLEQMRIARRFERYVVSTRTDGEFFLNVQYGSSRPVPKTVRLDVCQNCLDRLAWNRFSLSLSSAARKAAVNVFSIGDFFMRYGIVLFKSTPAYTSDTAPMNAYSDDFQEVSANTKARRLYRCEACGIDLSHPTNREYLHAHHVNGNKSDNREENLRVLCVRCHAQQPMHGHVRNSPQFQSFVRNFSGAQNASHATGAVNQSDTRDRPNASHESVDSLLATLRARGLRYEDMSANRGPVWVLGGREIEQRLQGLSLNGRRFQFAPNGSKSTRREPGWWMKTS